MTHSQWFEPAFGTSFLILFYFTVEVPNIVEFSAEYHKIPHEQFHFPQTEDLLREVHAFTHLHDFDGHKEAIIFADNDELDQMRDVFRWCESKSRDLELGLEWRISYFHLRTLFTFLNHRLPLSNYDESDAFLAFKTGKYDYSDLCFFHDEKDCRHCAISKAYIYSYILSDNFSAVFGVKELKRKQDDKTGTWKYTKN